MKIKKIFIIIILLFIVYCLLFPVFDAPAQGAGYEIEVSLPKGAAKGTEVSLTEYIRYLYLAGLGLIGLAALVALIIGGLIYMLSDTVFKKDQAKGMIQGAIFGLVLALSAYLILKTINPDLISLQAPCSPGNCPIRCKIPCDMAAGYGWDYTLCQCRLYP